MAELPEPSASDERVPIARGWSLPRYFTDVVRSDPAGYTCTFSVVVQGGQPHVLLAVLEPDPGTTVSPALLQLAGQRLPDHFVQVLEANARQPGEADWGSGAVWDDDSDDAPVWTSEPDPVERAAVVRSTMRRRITPEHLTRVVELHAKGGVEAVRREFGSDERTVRRWLARARDAGLR